MAKVIDIVDGTGSSDILNGSYSVTASVSGYNNTSISPSSVDITDGVNTYNFTISATGTLTLHVTEEGTISGTPIALATFIRTDSQGNEYGSVVTTDLNGDAVFNNVPFAVSDAPVIYYKQLSSDGAHEFDGNVQNTTMTASTATLEIQNAVPATRNINLTDSNYENLSISSGTITLE